MCACLNSVKSRNGRRPFCAFYLPQSVGDAPTVGNVVIDHFGKLPGRGNWSIKRINCVCLLDGRLYCIGGSHCRPRPGSKRFAKSA